LAVPGAAGDPSGPTALAADPLRPVGAPRADRPVLPVSAGDGFDHAAPDARGRQLPASAAGAHTPGRRTGQWLAGGTAPAADRVGQVHPAGLQFPDESAHHRWCADRERIGIGGQGGGQ
jgi:hypothetical protein